MKLNSISPAPGSKKPRTRVGRGASAGQGKTCGRGVKGQRARKGGYHKGQAIARAAQSGDQVLVMSNGGFGGIHDKLLQRLDVH